MTDAQQGNAEDFVRRDFIGAYAERWGTTTERAEGLMEHVEIGAKEDALADFYQQLCHLHTDVLLKHGGQVAQGLAIAVVEIQKLIPEEKKQAAVERFAQEPGSIFTGR